LSVNRLIVDNWFIQIYTIRIVVKDKYRRCYAWNLCDSVFSYCFSHFLCSHWSTCRRLCQWAALEISHIPGIYIVYLVFSFSILCYANPPDPLSQGGAMQRYFLYLTFSFCSSIVIVWMSSKI
jgi:hypothetical protein